MLSSPDFLRLEEIVSLELAGHDIGTEEKSFLARFADDITLIPPLRQLLSESTRPTPIFFATRHLSLLIDKVSPQWNAPEFIEVTTWLLHLLEARSLTFLDLGPLGERSVSHLGRTFGILLYAGFTTVPEFSNFYETINTAFPPGELRCLSCGILIFIEIVRFARETKDPKVVVRNRLRDSFLSLFAHAIHAMQQGPYVDGVDLTCAVTLAVEVLTFFLNEGRSSTLEKDEIVTDVCSPPSCFHEQLANPEFFQTIFHIFHAGVEIPEPLESTLHLIYCVCALKEPVFTTHAERAAVVETLCANLPHVIAHSVVRRDAKCLRRLSTVLYKLRLWKTVDFARDAPSYPELIAAAAGLTNERLADPEFFIREHQTLLYLMHFWAHCYAREVSPEERAQVSPMYERYIERLVNAVDVNAEGVIEILDLDGGQVCDAALVIPAILKLDVASLSGILLGHVGSVLAMYSQLLQEGPTVQLKAVDVKLALLIVLLTATLRDQLNSKPTRLVADHEVQCFLTVFDVMTRTESLLALAVAHRAMRTEQAIVIFLKNFRHMVFQCEQQGPGGEPVLFPSIVYTTTETESSIGICDRVVRRLAISLRFLAALEDRTVKTAVTALSCIVQMQLKPRGESIPLTMMTAPLLLIEEHLKSRYPFTCTDRFRREAATFMGILAKIALHFPVALEQLISDLDARFVALVSSPNTHEMYFLVHDLMGICGVSAARSKFSAWLFPAKLELFRNAVGSILEFPIVLNSLLKFWYRWLHDDSGERSLLKQMKHAADGIILFKLTAGFLTTVFTHLVGVCTSGIGMDDIANRQSKPIRYSMLVFAEIMGADYVMFGAFELYGDPVLKDLLTPFMALIEACNVRELFAYRNGGRALMETVKSLTGCHGTRVLGKSPAFFDFLIDLIARGYQQNDGKTVELSVDSAKNISDFLLERKDESIVGDTIVRNEAALARLVDATWDYLCNFGEPKYNNQVALKNLFLMWPGSLQAIYEKLRPQIPELNMNDFETRFQQIVTGAADLGGLNDSAFANALNQFRQFALRRNLFLIDR